MSVPHQSKGRGGPRQQVPEIRSLSNESSSSTIREVTLTNNIGRGRGTHLRQKLKPPDPHWKVSELTTQQFNSKACPSPRDEQNNVGDEIKVLVNYFPILDFPRSGLVYQYDIQINNKKGSEHTLYRQRALYQCWLSQYCCKYPEIYQPKIVFDNRKIIFTLDQQLPNIDETGITEIIPALNRVNCLEDYEICVKRVGDPIDLSLLNPLRTFHQMENDSNINFNYIQKIKQIFSIVLHENCSSHATYIYNRSFFTQPTLENEHGYWDLGLGKASWRGFYSCLVLANGTHQLLMNLDVSHAVFQKEQSFLDFLCDVMLHSPLGKRHYSRGRNVNKAKLEDVVRFLNQNISRNNYSGEIDFLRQNCQHLHVRSHVANKTIGYKIVGLAKAALEQTFLWRRPGEKERLITVENYYKEHYGIQLKYPTLPTLKMQNESCVPMEFVDVKPVKVKKITDEQRALLCLKSSMDPRQYVQTITAIRQNPEQQCFDQDPFIRAWNLNVDVKMLEIKAHILPAPEIVYNPNFRVRGGQQRSPGVWTNTNTEFFRPTKFPTVWALINLSSSMSEDSCKIFFKELYEVASDRGIDCPPPVIYQEFRYQSNSDSATQIIAELKDMMEQNDDCKFFIVILPENKNIGDRMYGDLKKLCELHYGFGIATQMIKLKEKESANKWSYSRLNSILLKINTKLDGTNSTLSVPDVIGQFFSRGHQYMYVGVDLSHGAPGSGRKCSTVAVVASADDIPNRYFKEIYVQERSAEARGESRECVVDMKQIMKSLISQYKEHRGYPPKAIVIYRDGIADSEFDSVFEYELMATREACVELSSIYQPYLTYIVVNKRHHTRFFPVDLKGNVTAGTVVDSREVINPTTYNFFLNSHHSDKGTSRPTHYHVLYDDNKLKSEQVQMLTYALCYTSARCTRSISIPAPVKYADLLAFRVNFYININDPFNTEPSATEATIPVNQTVNIYNKIKSKRIELSSKLALDCPFFL
ncbi:unnamed protein product [Rotaria magnacalcarata]|uniref:Uncharacterized protein n=2 Tax=Rotaria magnacalcarata TaxID=392030 RepID=A0A815PNM4_9BILA|nr:unnamed protein product [Rotaria magnacalcarata]